MVTPATKKQRVKQEPKTESGAPERKPMHFDVASDVATDCIVGLLLPKSKLDEGVGNRFSLDTVLVLTKSGGSLRRTEQNQFNTVQFSVGQDALWKSGALQVRGTRKEVGHLLTAVPIGIGEGIRTMFVSAPLSGTFAIAIAKNCIGLRNLSFSPCSGRHFPSANFCEILAARGSGLESLEIANLHANERVVGAIAEYCQALLRLKLSCPQTLCSLEPLWISLGHKLHNVEIGGTNITHWRS